MRKYIRHPSSVPIEVIINNLDGKLSDHQDQLQKDTLNNISEGGLSFHSDIKIDIGVTIKIRITLVQPAFETTGRVTWCTEVGKHYDIGIEILDKDQAYRTRMVEQVCHIEHYKKDVLESEGRYLSGKEAAYEWIEKYAHLFPSNGN